LAGWSRSNFLAFFIGCFLAFCDCWWAAIQRDALVGKTADEFRIISLLDGVVSASIAKSLEARDEFLR
jgi:hypothetical protein